MKARATFVVVLAALGTVAACAGPTESAVNEIVEQVRLDDPAAQSTYAQNRELLESEEALPLWIDYLENDSDPDVRRWAAIALGNIGDPEAVPALTAGLHGERDVREAATGALSQIGEEEAAAAFADALAAEDASRDTRIHCLVQLARMENADHIDDIVEVARSSDSLVAETAINTLGDIGSEEAVKPLGEIATDPSTDPAIRRAAIINLGRIGGEAARAELEAVQAALEGEENAEELHQLATATTGQL